VALMNKLGIGSAWQAALNRFDGTVGRTTIHEDQFGACSEIWSAVEDIVYVATFVSAWNHYAAGQRAGCRLVLPHRTGEKVLYQAQVSDSGRASEQAVGGERDQRNPCRQ